MIKREKWIELMNFFLMINLSTFGSNFTCVTLKIMDFWKCGVNKSSYLCDKKHECIIYDIKSIYTQNMFISNIVLNGYPKYKFKPT
jgi:hypothetical protein